MALRSMTNGWMEEGVAIQKTKTWQFPIMKVSFLTKSKIKIGKIEKCICLQTTHQEVSLSFITAFKMYCRIKKYEICF